MTALAAAYHPILLPTEYKGAVTSPSLPIHNILRSGIRKAQEQYELTQITSLMSFLDTLKTWPHNWDSYGAKKPKVKAIKVAKQFLALLFTALQAESFEWLNPNITADTNGEVVFEWWKQSKKLAIYISSREISYIKVPSPEIDDMEDGILYSEPEALKSIWAWLNY